MTHYLTIFLKAHHLLGTEESNINKNFFEKKSLTLISKKY